MQRFAAVPPTMRAARLHAPGGADALGTDEVTTPAPRDGEALLRVHAAALTRDELDWPTDRLPATLSYEVSGEVVAVGPGAEGVSEGDEMYALTPFDRDGGAADFMTVPAAVLARRPRTLSHIESAAVPLAALSAWQALFDHGRLIRGERVLIVGASGGVGHFATQLARHRGAHVVATASPATTDHVRALGADEVIDHTAPDWAASAEPFDLVFDTAGGERLAAAAQLVRDGGRLVSVAEEPPRRDGIDAVYFIVEPNREQLEQLSGLLDAGDVRASVDAVFELEEARAAYERAMSPGKRGKVVLRVRPDALV
jgi:NADPH:quinone reductase-like Zn-dependent oxidoreductase